MDKLGTLYVLLRESIHEATLEDEDFVVLSIASILILLCLLHFTAIQHPKRATTALPALTYVLQ